MSKKNRGDERKNTVVAQGDVDEPRRDSDREATANPAPDPIAPAAVLAEVFVMQVGHRPVVVRMPENLAGYAVHVSIMGGGNIKHMRIHGREIAIQARDTVPGDVEIHVLAVLRG